MMLGVGYHHAGVDLSDRKLVEEAFTLGDLPVLCKSKYKVYGKAFYYYHDSEK